MSNVNPFDVNDPLKNENRNNDNSSFVSWIFYIFFTSLCIVQPLFLSWYHRNRNDNPYGWPFSHVLLLVVILLVHFILHLFKSYRNYVRQKNLNPIKEEDQVAQLNKNKRLLWMSILGFSIKYTVIFVSALILLTFFEYRTVTIRSVKDLNRICQNPDGKYVLKETLQIKGKHNKPYVNCKFEGIFDGKNNTIIGATQPLFTEISRRGTAKNLNMTDVNIAEIWMITGSVAKVNDGTILNVKVEGNVSGRDYVGGIVGINHGVLENLTYSGTVSGWDRVGGIAGYSSNFNNFIQNVQVDGTIKGENIIGGIVGELYRSGINGSFFSGDVTGSDYIGGIVGVLNISEIYH